MTPSAGVVSRSERPERTEIDGIKNITDVGRVRNSTDRVSNWLVRALEGAGDDSTGDMP